MRPELNSLFEPVVITSNRKWAMKPFPKAPYLTKAYNWLRWAGGGKKKKNVLTERALADITRPEENETTEVQMESLFACFCPAAQCVLPCLLQSQLLSAAVLRQSLIRPVLVVFCFAADCSACSAVIWTPSCCWRASTTSAPRCCRVRGRTSLSSTPTRGTDNKKNCMCDNMLILHFLNSSVVMIHSLMIKLIFWPYSNRLAFKIYSNVWFLRTNDIVNYIKMT